jgi:hypothetical protein
MKIALLLISNIIFISQAKAEHTFIGKALGGLGDFIQGFVLLSLILVAVYFVFSLVGTILNSTEHNLRNFVRKLQGKSTIEEELNYRYQESLKYRNFQNKQRLLDEYSSLNFPGRYVMYSDRGNYTKTVSIKDGLNIEDVLNRIEAGELQDFNLRDIDTVHYHQN